MKECRVKRHNEAEEDAGVRANSTNESSEDQSKQHFSEIEQNVIWKHNPSNNECRTTGEIWRVTASYEVAVDADQENPTKDEA